MFSTENLLGIPAMEFGLAGIHAGDIISRQVSSQGKGFHAVYDLGTKRVTILNSSDLSTTILYDILYSSPFSLYNGWYPIIVSKRNDENNLVVKFSQCPPQGIPLSAILKLNLAILKLNQGRPSLSLTPAELFMDFPRITQKMGPSPTVTALLDSEEWGIRAPVFPDIEPVD